MASFQTTAKQAWHHETKYDVVRNSKCRTREIYDHKSLTNGTKGRHQQTETGPNSYLARRPLSAFAPKCTSFSLHEIRPTSASAPNLRYTLKEEQQTSGFVEVAQTTSRKKCLIAFTLLIAIILAVAITAVVLIHCQRKESNGQATTSDTTTFSASITDVLLTTSQSPAITTEDQSLTYAHKMTSDTTTFAQTPDITTEYQSTIYAQGIPSDTTTVATSTIDVLTSQPPVITTEDQSSTYVTDCKTLYDDGAREDGIYSVNPDGIGEFDVYCELDSNRNDGTIDGGWTVIQRRLNDSVDFYRGWSEYEDGFGDLDGNVWLGLAKIYRFTAAEPVELHIYMESFSGAAAYATCSFSISDSTDNYRLNVSDFSGTARDYGLTYHNGMQFSTYDRDNDPYFINCAGFFQGAWWYRTCLTSNLNGQYSDYEHLSCQGVSWHSFPYYDSNCYTLKTVVMKIR